MFYPSSESVQIVLHFDLPSINVLRHFAASIFGLRSIIPSIAPPAHQKSPIHLSECLQYVFLIYPFRVSVFFCMFFCMLLFYFLFYLLSCSPLPSQIPFFLSCFSTPCPCPPPRAYAQKSVPRAIRFSAKRERIDHVHEQPCQTLEFIRKKNKVARDLR